MTCLHLFPATSFNKDEVQEAVVCKISVVLLRGNSKTLHNKVCDQVVENISSQDQFCESLCIHSRSCLGPLHFPLLIHTLCFVVAYPSLPAHFSTAVYSPPLYLLFCLTAAKQQLAFPPCGLIKLLQ